MQNLIDLNRLAQILGRSPATIKKDLRRNPSAVPPRVIIPGTRSLGVGVYAISKAGWQRIPPRKEHEADIRPAPLCTGSARWNFFQ